ncbi:hypothetical protein D3C73_1571650 [compost metagenome]
MNKFIDAGAGGSQETLGELQMKTQRRDIILLHMLQRPPVELGQKTSRIVDTHSQVREQHTDR